MLLQQISPRSLCVLLLTKPFAFDPSMIRISMHTLKLDWLNLSLYRPGKFSVRRSSDVGYDDFPESLDCNFHEDVWSILGDVDDVYA